MKPQKIALYVAKQDDSSVEKLCHHLENETQVQVSGLKLPKKGINKYKSTAIDWSDINPKEAKSDETIARALSDCTTMIMFVHPADCNQVRTLTEKFTEAAKKANIQRFIWVAPACGVENVLGQQLLTAENIVKSSGLSHLVVRHAPLFSEILAHKQELKFRRTLSLPFGDKALPWIAPEAVAQVVYGWLLNGEKSTSGILTGSEDLSGDRLAEDLTKVLQAHVNSRTYAQGRFAAIDSDRSGNIDPEELFPYLSELGYSQDEAEAIFSAADTDQSGSIDFAEFVQGLEKHLDQILAEVPTEIYYLKMPKLAAIHDLTKTGMDRATATAQLDLMESLTTTSDRLNSSPELTEYLGESNLSFADWVVQYALDLINVHIIPQQGISTVIEGELSGKPALFTRLLKANDRLLVGQHTLDGKQLELSWANEDLSTAETVPYKVENESERVLTVRDGKIVQISVQGYWLGRRLATQLMIQEKPIPRWQLSLFRELGELQIEEVTKTGDPDEVICNCVQTKCGQIQELIDSGLETLENLAELTQVTTICGGCVPLIEEMLGSASLAVAEWVNKQDLGRGIFRFQFRPVDRAVVASKPGQHILIQGRVNGRWVTRAYTLTSPSQATESYEITVKREELGEFSRWLCDRADSDSLLRISEPRGEYFLGDESPVVLFAGGIGVTPGVAMMRTLALKGESSVPFHLDWSAPYDEDFVLREELDRLTQEHPNLTVTYRATRRQGRITPEIVQTNYPATTGGVAFMCGPEAFMDSVRGCLKTANWEDAAIRQELFSSKLDEEGNAEKTPPSRAPMQLASGITLIEQESFGVEAINSVMAEAEAFLKQCYLERGLPQAFLARWEEVKEAIEQTGTYEHTYDELAYGAKLAWRNSSRCVGRDFWQTLNVVDRRDLETEAEMFQAILEHIKIGTNNGDLRAIITIFKPDGRLIWSPQYFRYAGYRQADGSIVGDPDNVEITDLALKLGWPGGPGTCFDYLPIILQLPGKEPQWFDIPPELILEVPLEHPHYEWFAELGLKWYALPAVSSLVFDVGGIQYTAAPFNGFYMGTEIGAFNFGNSDRYNMLPEIASRLGLDRSNDMTLWKDRAIVEMNIAVLYSYKKHGVRMLDHHTVTESFMGFVEKEQNCGRPVQADRDWIVPPMSASTTPVWTAEFDGNRKIKPGYFYRQDPWKVTETEASGCPFHDSH